MGNRAQQLCRSMMLAAGIVALAGCAERHSEFTLLMPGLPLDQEIADELVAVFEQNSEQTIRLVPLPDRFESPLDAIEAGYADLAFAANAQEYRQGVTTVMPLYPTVLHVMYRRELDISDPRTMLQQATVYAGDSGSSSRLALDNILSGLHLGEDDVTFVDDAVELPDVIVIYIPLSPATIAQRLEDLNAGDAYAIVSFGRPEDIGTGSAIDRAVLLNPRVSPFVIPVGTYGDMQPEAVVTLSVDKLLVARRGLPSAEVYDLIMEIRRLQPALAATRPMLFDHLNAEFDASSSTFVLHPGSQAFTQRDEPDIYERYSGVAEVVVTLVIGLISGSFAVVQIYNRRRKNRIDRFYGRAIELRDSITASSSGPERAAAAEQVRKLQNEAFAMLIDEKLAADESFRIFVTLTNDILSEMGESRGPTSA